MNLRTTIRHAGSASVIYLLCATAALATTGNYREAMIEAVASKEKALDSNSATDWQEAFTRFRAADAIQRTPESEYELAFAAAKLGETGLAVESYSGALENGLSGTAAERARSFVSENVDATAALVVSGAPGTHLIIRGFERGQLPLRRAIVVEAGSVTLEIVSADGMHTLRRINVAPGQRVSIALEAQESAAPSENPTSAQQTNSSDYPLVAPPTIINRTHAPRNEPSASTHRQTAWAIVGAGAGLSALGVGSLIVSSSKVSDSRHDLFSHCAVQTDGPDTCAHAKVDQMDEAQAASDSIATWKAVRTGSWLGLSLGVASVLTGVAWLGASTPNQRSTAQLPNVIVDRQSIWLSYQGTFF